MTPPRLSTLLLCSLALAACQKAADGAAQSSRGLKVEAYDAPVPKAPLGGRLDTLRPHADPLPAVSSASAASGAPAASDAPAAAAPPLAPKPLARAAPLHLKPQRVTAPAAPRVTEPHFDLYDREPAPSAPAATAADMPGFHITVPICRQAERQSDPLARTPECQALIQAADAQARACAKAFRDGDDKAAMSPGCRHAAQFR